MKLLFLSDLHIRATAPINRKDNYVEAQFNKLEQLIAYANEIQAPILCAGDLLDSWKTPGWLLNRLIRALTPLEVPFYVIPGNHDSPGHNPDFIEDSSMPSPVESATFEGLRRATQDMLHSLTPREAKVLRMRFGIDMTTDHTLEEVGKQFDVTRERIRQIEAKALRKLRHPSRSEQLRSFLD